MFTVTFYSFKGGVGRTMALMNVAFDLIKTGNNVTVLDFDLEAPGLKSFEGLNKSKKKGLQDYVLDYFNSGGKKVPEIDDFIYKVKFEKQKKGYGNLFFMPASADDKFEEIKWADLYAKLNGYILFEELKLAIKESTNSHYLLIDSRTGYTDHSSICTRQLPDLIVGLFFPNNQNIDGIADVVEQAVQTAEENNAILPILYVASRLPVGDDETGSLKEKLDYAKNKLFYKSAVYPELLTLHHNDKTELLDQLILINYEAKGEIKLKSEYQNLSKKIQLHNEKSTQGNIFFLRYLLYEKNKSPDDINEKIKPNISFDISKKDKGRIDRIAFRDWNNPSINFLSSRICEKLFDEKSYIRIFWHDQLTVRIFNQITDKFRSLKKTEKLNQLQNLELITKFAGLAPKNISKAKILKDDGSSLLEASFDHTIVPPHFLNEVNEFFGEKNSYKNTILMSAHMVLFEHHRLDHELDDFLGSRIEKTKLISNALFVIISLNYNNFIQNYARNFSKTLSDFQVSYSSVIRNFYTKINNYFYESPNENSYYPCEVLYALDLMDSKYNSYQEVYELLLLNSDSSVYDLDKKTVMQISNQRSSILLFEKSFVSAFVLKDSGPLSRFARLSVEYFFENFKQSLKLSHKYFNQPAVRASYALKALIIEKLCILFVDSIEETFPRLNFKINTDTFELGYDSDFISEDDDFLYNSEGKEGGISFVNELTFYEYIEKCIDEIHTSDTLNKSVINPLTQKEMPISKFEVFSSKINSLKNIQEFNFIE